MQDLHKKWGEHIFTQNNNIYFQFKFNLFTYSVKKTTVRGMAASPVESESSYHFYVKEIITSKQIALAWTVVVSRIRNSGSIAREISWAHALSKPRVSWGESLNLFGRYFFLRQAQLDRTESVSCYNTHTTKRHAFNAFSASQKYPISVSFYYYY